MNPETTALLDKLATKLGVTTEYLWSVLIKQAPIEVMSTVVLGVLLTISWLVFYRIYKKINLDSIEPTFEGVIIFILTVVLSLLSFVWLVGVHNNFISPLFNPEYWALKEILYLLKK